MQRERRRVVRWLPWVTWIAILAGVVAVVAISLRPATETVTRTVTREAPGPAVPDVAGLGAPAARRALERAGFWVRTAHEPSARAARGRVVGTSPPGSTRLRIGAQVTLLVSSGRPRLRVPAVEGTSRSTAEERLLRRGFRVVVVRRESDEPPGAVLAQNPPAGRRVRGDSVVRIAVAARAAPVTVPAVAGSRFERAVERASGAGLALRLDRRRAARSRDVGRILRQSPAAGRRVPRGSRLTLTVGVARG